MADAQREAAIKAFSIAPEQAGIFIYLDEFIGTAVKLDIWLDGVPLGQTVAMSFLYKSVAPGKHTITSFGENTETLEVEIMPGTLAYVRQEAKMGRFRAHQIASHGRGARHEWRAGQPARPKFSVDARP